MKPIPRAPRLVSRGAVAPRRGEPARRRPGAARRIDWPGAAEALAAAIQRARLDPTVVAWADAARRRRRPWGVAVSGGADSVATLLLVWAHWPQARSRLRVLHFDHRLRGAASRGDAEFCRKLASALGIRFVTARWNRRGRGQPSEATAREARLAFLFRHADILWLGHHMDDVAETLLMRLARGSGAAGLGAPRPVQEFPGGRLLLRPLLTLGKSEVLAALREAGAAWREDVTNQGDRYFRNRIRNAVIPAWAAAAGRDAVAGAARSRLLLAEDDAALELWADEITPFDGQDLLLDALAGKPRAIVRRCLLRWLHRSRNPPDISRQAFETLLACVEGGRSTRQSLGRNLFAVIRKGRLYRERGKPRGTFQRRVN